MGEGDPKGRKGAFLNNIPRKSNSPKYIINLSRELRRDMAEAETLLWNKLRRKRISELRFRRQYPIDRYITNFCCPEIGLIIEVDGDVHDGTKEYDSSRDGYLEAGGYTVIRIKNDEIKHSLSDVIERIREKAEELR